ncbi:MAG: hypothetical protein LBC31_06930 [Treponema sp.]|jgi:hypothetical protein|nr:hypothetical protein [Treponema sp.]
MSLLAAIGIGAAVGGISTWLSGNKQKKALQEQKENAWKSYLINKDFSDTQFAIQQGEALTTLGIQGARLREDVTTGTENFNTGLLGQAYGIQDAQMGLASQLGAYDVNQGASGTRGNEAGGLVKAYAQTSFDRSLEVQKQQTGQQLEGMITGANRAGQDLNREKESWGEGGYRTRLYNAEDERNRQLALLGQSGYDSAISNATPGVFDYAIGGLSGASTGMSLYSGISGAAQYADKAQSSYASPAASQAPSFSLGGDSYGGYGSTALGMLNVNSFNSVGGGLQTGAYNPLAYGYDKTLFSPTGGQFPAQPSFNPFAGMFNGFNK